MRKNLEKGRVRQVVLKGNCETPRKQLELDRRLREIAGRGVLKYLMRPGLHKQRARGETGL